MHIFWDIPRQKCRDLENRVRGPSTSSKIWKFTNGMELPQIDYNVCTELMLGIDVRGKSPQNKSTPAHNRECL